MRIITSNRDKLREFQQANLPFPVELGDDLPEVQSDPSTVVFYKAKDAGANCIVEDTSLYVLGQRIGVDIRWMLDKLQSGELAGQPAEWRVLLGKNDGTRIFLYEGSVTGTITAASLPDNEGFGFDPYFIPDGQGGPALTLAQLARIQKKTEYSARTLAIQELVADRYVCCMKVADIPPWTGAYQKKQ